MVGLPLMVLCAGVTLGTLLLLFHEWGKVNKEVGYGHTERGDEGRRARLLRLGKNKRSVQLHMWGLAHWLACPCQKRDNEERGVGQRAEDSSEVWDSL